MEEGSKFVVQFDFDPGQDESKLFLKVGDVIEFLYGDDGEDWWYGKLAGTEGWFPSAYASHIEEDGSAGEEHTNTDEPIIIKTDEKEISEEALYRNLSPQERRASLRKIFNRMIESEQQFGEKIRLLLVQIVAPMLIRDTPFKRDFMQDYSLAVIFSVIQDIETASSDFLQSLRQSDDVTDLVAKCFKDFSPTLRLFSQYTLESSNAFNALKKLGKPLNQFLKTCTLPEDLPMEQILVLPVDHYSTYLEYLKSYVYTSGNPHWDGAIISESEYSKLHEALSTMSDYSREVDATLENEKEKQLLLTIQNRCKLSIITSVMFKNNY
jgi:hypothetical protein